jgi:hypothetical protein
METPLRGHFPQHCDLSDNIELLAQDNTVEALAQTVFQ